LASEVQPSWLKARSNPGDREAEYALVREWRDVLDAGKEIHGLSS
jgi:hypothetical protein